MDKPWNSSSFRLASITALAAIASLALAECPSYGCGLSPLDIATAKDSLEALVAEGDTDKTTMTLCGNKGGPPEKQINQDRAILYSPYIIEGSNVQVQLLGVFDGHGSKGELTSQHAAIEVPRLLAEKLAIISFSEEEEKVPEAIKETFIEVDKTDPSLGEGGCTASIILRIGDKLYVGNAGDSASFISAVVDDKDLLVYISREDKPDLPGERARIQQMGGYVYVPRDPNEDVPRAYMVDEDGYLSYGLAMSRSLGDWGVKGVIPDPIVDVLNISDIIQNVLTLYSEFCGWDDHDEEDTTEESEENTCKVVDPSEIRLVAVSATDGMMDYLSPAYISSVLADAFRVEGNLHPHTAAEKLILEAANGWDTDYDGDYRDDIAVSAVEVFL